MSAAEMNAWPKTAKLLLIKIPFVYLMVCCGILFDFLIGLPFMVLTEISRRDRRRKKP